MVFFGAAGLVDVATMVTVHVDVWYYGYLIHVCGVVKGLSVLYYMHLSLSLSPPSPLSLYPVSL